MIGRSWKGGDEYDDYIPVNRLNQVESEMNEQLDDARRVQQQLEGEAGRLAQHIDTMARTYNTQMVHLVCFTEELRQRNLELGAELQDVMRRMEVDQLSAVQKQKDMLAITEKERKECEDSMRQMLEKQSLQKQRYQNEARQARDELVAQRQMCDQDAQQQEDLIRQLEGRRASLEYKVAEAERHRMAMELELRDMDAKGRVTEEKQRRWAADRERFQQDRQLLQAQLGTLRGNLEYLEDARLRHEWSAARGYAHGVI